MSVSLPLFRLLLAFLAVLVSLYYNAIWVTTGSAKEALYAGLIFVFITGIAKMLWASDIPIYLQHRQQDKALGVLIIVILLAILNVAATSYNLITQPAKGYLVYDNNNAAITELNQSIDVLRTEINKCPERYYTACKNPRLTQLRDLEKQRNEMYHQQTNLFASVAGREFWQRLSEIVGISANALENTFVILRATLLEIAEIVLIAQASSALRRNKPVMVYADNFTEKNMPDFVTEPNLPKPNEALAKKQNYTGLLHKNSVKPPNKKDKAIPNLANIVELKKK